jgi:hypothetical protein
MEEGGRRTGEGGVSGVLGLMTDRTEQLRSLRDLLREAGELSDTAWLYLSGKEPWTLESRALVAESEEVAPEEENDPDAGTPEAVRKLGFVEVLPIATVKEVVRNAQMQDPDVDDETLRRALIHYYDHDAFVEL